MTVSAEIKKPQNTPTRYYGFDAVRIFAALAVVLTHSFALTGFEEDRPIISVGNLNIAPGYLGVCIFFVTSGFLVAQSWGRTSGVREFIRNRFARIWPALTLLIFASVFILGPIVTTVSTGEYFRDKMTLEYLVKNSTLVLGTASKLPGVFVGQPGSSVNGSLWTLPQEIYAYIILASVGLTGLLRRWWGGLLVFIGFVCFWRFGFYAGSGPRGIGFSLSIVNVSFSTALGAWFFAGVALVKIPLRGIKLFIPGVLLTGVAFAVGEPLLFFIGFPMLVIGCGASSPKALRGLHQIGDPSYGIYIYSFPLQQVLFRYGVATTPVPMFLLAAPLATLLGFASWRFLEHPALIALKRKNPAATIS